MPKARIWCEAVCSQCGGMIGFFYRNEGTIKRLKHEIADWECVDGDNVCEYCKKKLKNGESK